MIGVRSLLMDEKVLLVKEDIADVTIITSAL